MSNLGLVIALTARSYLFPREFALLCQIQREVRPFGRGMFCILKKAFRWGPDGWFEKGQQLARIFGLRYGGKGLRYPEHGYIRLPTSLRNEWVSRGGRKVDPHLVCARYEPDVEEIKKWATCDVGTRTK